MFNKILKTVLFVTLPMHLLYADNNRSYEDPFKEDAVYQHFEQLRKDMDKVFENFNHSMFKEMKMDMRFPKSFAGSPSTDLVDKGAFYELKMDLAGMDDKSIQIDVEDNYLKVIAKRESHKEKKENEKIIHQERHVGMVQRGMTLPKDADAHSHESEYKNGVLTIKIPKKK
jgi:HSP20 family protein